MLKTFIAVGVAGAGAFASQSALAWTDMGHQVVGIIAEHYLSPAARAKAVAMLQADTDSLTAHDFANEATWADRFRANDDSGRTAKWHFADIDAEQPNVATACFGRPALPAGTLASAGPAQACVIDKIDQFSAELADDKIDAKERLLALKYLLNLVGDVHQPMNVAIEEGNNHGIAEKVEARTITAGDLYGYWGDSFVHQLGPDAQDIAQQLIAKITPADQTQWIQGTPESWALEASQIGVVRGYGVLSEGDDHGIPILSNQYVDTALQTVRLQLSRAGVRLAEVINQALAPTKSAAHQQAHRSHKAKGH